MTLLIVLAILVGLVAVIRVAFAAEIRACFERDPAARSLIEVLLNYPGLHILILHRLAHPLERLRLPILPRLIMSLGRWLTGIEIHPGARIGRGLFIDHGMGVVIGETAVIGDNVTLFQGVTLGGTGKERGKRHPTLGNNVVIGAGAKVLGNIVIGEGSYIGANAVVIKEVPPNSTVVGIPGRITKQDGRKIDLTLDHIVVNDPVMENMAKLFKRIKQLEEKSGIKGENGDSDFVI